jgi:hypothetical protein
LKGLGTMDRIMDAQTPRISREVRPVDRLSPAKRLPGDRGDGGRSFKPPYGVVDRVTLSPEGRAMAVQQRAAQTTGPIPQPITYGPHRLPAAMAPQLPYKTKA